MRLALLAAVLLLVGCKNRPASDTVIDAGPVRVQHAGSSQKPPAVSNHSTASSMAVPPKSTITVTEEAGSFLAVAPDNRPVNVPVRRKITLIQLPDDAGATFETNDQDVQIVGSAGHAPPPPPTPYEKSLSIWTYAGVILVALGIFFCTPWGGMHFRVGALIALGGVTMSMLGYFLNEVTQLGLPSWFPVVGIAGVAAAIALYWGYRLRQKQAAESTQPAP